LVATRVAQPREREVEQRTADAVAPVRGVDVERGDLARAGLVDRPGRDREADEAGDGAAVLGDERGDVRQALPPGVRALADVNAVDLGVGQ
jgi:hypothetical protein